MTQGKLPLDVNEAFKIVRNYLTGEPIYADWSSVQPIMILPSGNSWGVLCEYKRMVGNQQERALVMIDDQGRVSGLTKI